MATFSEGWLVERLEGECRKVRSLAVAISRPNIIENEETMSALSCRPVSVDMLEMRSSA
jgi:hypothetical protein